MAIWVQNLLYLIGGGIVGFLYGILNKYSVEDCLKKGAEVASKVVEVFEPWVK